MDGMPEIKRLHFVEHVTISDLAKQFKLSRPTIRKHLNMGRRAGLSDSATPVLFEARRLYRAIDDVVGGRAALPGKKRKRTAQRLYECLQAEGYVGSAVPRYVKAWKASRSSSPAIKQAFVPLLFPACKTCQFDWSHERVVLGGVQEG